MQTKKVEIGVGVFLLLALLAALFLALKVANVSALKTESTYQIHATFNNIGGLKNHAPVRIGGVTIGRVSSISLDEKSYLPQVTLDIDQRYNQIPNTSSLAVRTSGLLGEQYLALNLGFDDPELGTHTLQNGDTLEDTKSALGLEDLIGQFLYKSNDNGVQNPGNAEPALSQPQLPETDRQQ